VLDESEDLGSVGDRGLNTLNQPQLESLVLISGLDDVFLPLIVWWATAQSVDGGALYAICHGKLLIAAAVASANSDCPLSDYDSKGRPGGDRMPGDVVSK